MWTDKWNLIVSSLLLDTMWLIKERLNAWCRSFPLCWVVRRIVFIFWIFNVVNEIVETHRHQLLNSVRLSRQMNVLWQQRSHLPLEEALQILSLYVNFRIHLSEKVEWAFLIIWQVNCYLHCRNIRKHLWTAGDNHRGSFERFDNGACGSRRASLECSSAKLDCKANSKLTLVNSRYFLK